MNDDDTESTTSTISSALAHQRNTFDIYSSSWGFVTEGQSFASLTDDMVDAIETGIQLV